MRFLIEAYTQADIDTVDTPSYSAHKHAPTLAVMFRNLSMWPWDDEVRVEVTEEEG